MKFDLTDLRLFLAVMDCGSITHGAERANLSLPAASERLHELERSAGVKLLHRGRRGTLPTPAGEALVDHARIVLRQLDKMRANLSEYAEGAQTVVCLLANTAAMTEYLPGILAPWLASHPRVDLDLKERQSTDIVRAVSNGLAEIGIVSDAVDPAGLQTHPFTTDRLVVVTSLDDILAKRQATSFSTVLNRGFVGLTDGALYDYVAAQAALRGRTLKVRTRVRTFEGLCRMVAHGVGVGIVPEPAARRNRRTLPIASVRLTDKWATRRLSICFRSEEDLTPFAADLVGHLSKQQPRKKASQSGRTKSLL